MFKSLKRKRKKKENFHMSLDQFFLQFIFPKDQAEQAISFSFSSLCQALVAHWECSMCSTLLGAAGDFTRSKFNVSMCCSYQKYLYLSLIHKEIPEDLLDEPLAQRTPHTYQAHAKISFKQQY